MADIMVSVIIPVYNAEKTVEAAVRSVMEQTYRNIEIIIVDDGSSDGSPEICDRLVKAINVENTCNAAEDSDSGNTENTCNAVNNSDSGNAASTSNSGKAAKNGNYDKIHMTAQVIHEANSGVSKARNQGLKLVTGKYVAFVDADDRMLPDCIERLVTAAYAQAEESATENRHSCSGYGEESATKNRHSCAGYREESATKNRHSCADYREEPANKASASNNVAIVDMTKAINGEGLISGYYYVENAIFNSDTHVWGKLFLTAAIKESMAEFPKGLTIGEDMLFLLKIALFKGNKRSICCIPEGGYIYNDNDEGAMKKAFSPSYMDQITCWEIAEKELAAKAESLSPFIFMKLAGITIMAAMLVAGKLACIQNSNIEKTKFNEYINRCRAAIKHSLKRNGAFASLPTGYKAKVLLFMISSRAYMKAYGNWKK